MEGPALDNSLYSITSLDLATQSEMYRITTSQGSTSQYCQLRFECADCERQSATGARSAATTGKPPL